MTEIVSQNGLRLEYATRIRNACNRGKEAFIEIGHALIEAKRKLPHGEFEAMIKSDLPFSPWSARQFMRIAADPKLSDDHCTSNVLPSAARTLDELHKLNDNQFEDGIAKGLIHPEMTVHDAQALVKNYLAPAPFSTDKFPHRPNAIKCGPPTAPQTPLQPRSWPELLYTLIERRHALDMTQESLDTLAGWPDRQTGKFELPHQDTGRLPTVGTLFEWFDVLDIRISLELGDNPKRGDSVSHRVTHLR